MTKNMLDAALNYDQRVRADMGGMEIRVEEEALANTEGVNVVEEGTESTGNASRRRLGLFFVPSLPFESPPQLVPSNLIIKSGDRTKAQLIEEVDKGVLVERFSGNTELSNGNFSGSVKQGFLIENGEIKHPLIGTMISGNSYELMKNISGISREFKVLESRGISSVQSPIIRAEKMKITGKT